LKNGSLLEKKGDKGGKHFRNLGGSRINHVLLKNASGIRKADRCVAGGSGKVKRGKYAKSGGAEQWIFKSGRGHRSMVKGREATKRKSGTPQQGKDRKILKKKPQGRHRKKNKEWEGTAPENS